MNEVTNIFLEGDMKFAILISAMGFWLAFLQTFLKLLLKVCFLSTVMSSICYSEIFLFVIPSQENWVEHPGIQELRDTDSIYLH